MLSIKNISAGYDKKVVLSDVNMDIDKGDFVGLIGPNGSGKTTLLRVISKVLAPYKGHVLLDGEDVAKIARNKLARTMAFLTQEISLNLPFTVRQMTLMGRFPYLSQSGKESDIDIAIAADAMELADVSHLGERFITEVSGGERQRALIAMCLAQQPEILLLDEPTNHLDVGHQLAVLDLIRKLNRRTNMTVVAVFHDLNLASEYCDKVMVLDDGKVATFGTPQEVLTSEMILKVYRAKVLTQINPISQKPHIVIAADMNRSD
ncbi:MAG: ABC transporter ATP-binding protein [Planctomycetes bacterium]|nr:ABC transporter ATP-binding protein [Planctomycetota bacterium]